MGTDFGNRYIFATNAGGVNLTGTVGTPTTLPISLAGTHYSVAKFVNANTYGDVFTQNTAANVLDGSLGFTSPGSLANASAGAYNLALVVPLSTATGYNISAADGAYGTLTLPSSSAVASTNGSVTVNDAPQTSLGAA